MQRMRNACCLVEGMALPKSAKLARELLDGRLEELRREVRTDATATMDVEIAEDLRVSWDTLWERVIDEASRQVVHVVEPLVWDAPFREFVESPRAAFGLMPAYDPELPEQFDENLERAARHVRFRLMDGATIFILRAMEVVLKYYYTLLGGQKPNRSWGVLRTRFLDMPECEAPQQLLEGLKRLTNEYRNIVMHVTEVELTLDDETALNVLIRCRAVAEGMMHHLTETGLVSALAGSPSELVFDEE